MKARTASRAAWSLWSLIAGLGGTTILLTVLSRSHLDREDLIVLLGMSVAAIGYGTVGALITARRHNRTGWIFFTIALGFAVYAFTWAYVLRALVIAPGSLPGATLMAWVRTWVLTFAFAPIPLLLLVFPTGRLPSRRWRPVAWILIGLPALNLVGTSLQSGTIFEGYGVRVANPFGVPGLALESGPWVVFIVLALVWFGAAVSSVVALVQRFQRAAGEERQQLRWLAYVAGSAGALMIPGLVLGAIGASSSLPFVSVTVFMVALFVGIPVASAIAILKYRLYDLDVVVKKTVVLGLLAGLVTLLYLAIVVGIGSAVRGSESSPASLLEFGAAAVLALVFQPIRRRANHLANRLVYGNRATPYEVLSELSERMSGAYSSQDILPRMAEILGAGTGARLAQVWLRVGDGLRLAAAWPPVNGARATSIELSGEELPAVPGVSAFPVRHQGELLGALGIAAAPSDPITPSKEKLIQDLAAQAGLVLRNARLIEELRASRQRIVSAQDARAKALERNIHDGAQQQLVALMVKLRLAEELAKRDPERTPVFLQGLQADATNALENLRDLARGIYPPLLADQGLGAALSAQARNAPLLVTVETDGIGRYSQEAEAAVYFCCLEALQNVTKYAAASRVTMELSEVEEGTLVFSVTDDGGGYDAARVAAGSGLQNMADRLSALGGALEVRSRPGAGTTVAGRIPVSRRESMPVPS